jgi:hypothetical protein
LNGNMATAPYGTTAKPEALFYVPRTVRSLTSTNPSDTIALASIELGIPKITDREQRLELMDTIHKHYVAGLADVDLNASQGSAFDANSMNTRTSILFSETRNLQLNYSVVISITADFTEPRANARVYLLCTE